MNRPQPTAAPVPGHRAVSSTAGFKHHLSSRGVPQTKVAALILLAVCSLQVHPQARDSTPTAPAAAQTQAAVVLTEAERGELIRALREQYGIWSAATIQRNTELWQQTTSTHRRHQLHNETVSSGARFPEAIFHAIQPPPQLTPLRLVDLRVGGDVARLTFFGPLHGDRMTAPPPGTPHDLMHVIYHREDGKWKVDGITYVSLQQKPDWQQQFMNLDYSPLQDPVFAFSKLKPAPPALCNAPEHVAMLQIFSSGYRVTAAINGYQYPSIEDGNTHLIVIGGLNEGLNDLQLEIEPSTADAAQDGHVAINLWVRDADPQRDSSRVFHYMPKPGQIPPQHRAAVVVNGRTLAEGRR